MEKSPSLVYGARLELVYGLIAHRGFESLLLRQNMCTNACGNERTLLDEFQEGSFATFDAVFAILQKASLFMGSWRSLLQLIQTRACSIWPRDSGRSISHSCRSEIVSAFTDSLSFP